MSNQHHPFVDCQGLAGAWTLGTVQTGRFDLMWRVGQPAGKGVSFGDDVIQKNRGMLGVSSWFDTQGSPASEWNTDVTADYVCGTPPCSGFSLMNASKKSNKRGPDSPINSCMKDLARYGARCVGTDGEQGAKIIAFESVQQAYTTGRDLMLYLRDLIEQETGNPYELTHVMMSGSSVGSAQYRHRYYFVCHRIPFQIAHPEPHHVITYEDAIGDLQKLELQWAPQPYVLGAPADSYAGNLRSESGEVSDHMAYLNTRDAELLEEVVGHLSPGESVRELLEGPKLEGIPVALKKRYSYDEKDWKEPRGWQWFKRVDSTKPGYVVTGGGAGDFVHWSEPRFLTIREISRLMGYPDDWQWPTESLNANSALVGKCCPVQSGKWISEAVADALDGTPQEDPHSVQLADREFLHNSSLDYRRWPKQVSGWEFRKNTVTAG